MSEYVLRSARFQAAEVLNRVIQNGDTVVDATMGNGHDTVMLAKLVGENGHVYAFDVQEMAVASTRQKLEAEGLLERVTLLCTGHQNMKMHVPVSVRAVAFNLGWLPGGDKSITTLWETTFPAINAALDLLLPMGVCTVCVYPGHEAGEKERKALAEYLANLPPQRYNILRQTFINAGPGAPECFVIQRQGA
ncbi:MAG: methyltransferase domain-containing protein [Clostridiales bacterium]|nr:methyltransferase domain-containing protein [Clostridiales bacterium]